MQVKMYGKTVGCKFCTRAKTICEMNDFELEFIDVEAEGISGAELSEIVGTRVQQIPQIFVDGVYVGGCDKFEELLASKS